MTERALAFAVVVFVALLSGVARADNRSEAAERFALAQAAERRGDWQAAIAEYEQAYKLQPHPVVLFNIGNDYEKLGDNRAAAEYFTLYLTDAPDADDAGAVKARIRGLEALPSLITFRSKQRDAVIFVDTEEVGKAPLELELSAGRHTIYAEHEGTRTAVMQLLVQYGEPRTVDFDVHARPGLLVVTSNVKGAEIRLDGNVIGTTPFSEQVPSGKHILVVGKRGYQSYERQISVAPQGSEQVRAVLEPLAGTQVEGESASGGGGNFVIGTGYGFNVGQSGLRYEVVLGYRTSGHRIDANLLLGSFGEDIAGGAGAELRLFISTGVLRPYLRGCVLIGAGGDQTDDDRGIGFEGGVGILWSPKRNESVKFGWEYYVAANVLYVGGEDDPMIENDGAKLSFPIVGGLAIRFGQ